MKSRFFALAVILAPSLAVAAPDFHADVAPLLRDYCVGCHNASDREGDLSVETFAELMRGGESGEGIVAGKADASFLIHTLTKRDKPAMPPKKEPQPTAAEIAILTAWVDAGAKGPAKAQDVSILSTLVVPKVAAGAGVRPPVSAVAFSPDGKQLAVARHRVVQVLDAVTRQPLRELADHPGVVNAVEFSPDGRQLLAATGVTGLRGVAVLWDVAAGTKVREFGAGSLDILYDAVFSPDGRTVATAGYDRAVAIWDAASGALRHRIEVHTGAVFDLAFSAEGKVLASASADQTVKLWNVATGERLDTLNQPQDEQYTVVFTPDGKHILAAGADNRIRLWRFLSVDKPRLNPLVQARFAHEGDIVRLGVSPDGKMLVSSSADLSLKAWTLPGLEQKAVLGRQPDVAATLAMEADGSAVLVGRMDGSLEAYALGATAAGVAEVADAGAGGGPGAAARGVAAALVKVAEVEPNDTPGQASALASGSEVAGTIGTPGDADLFRFRARAGEEWVFEVNAERMKSPLDSRIEVLDGTGQPVEQVVLRAVRDSWFTFRGKDSNVSNDFRVHNWMEMELNDYLYANGEVVKLWLYPRGADSGFDVYPGGGKRHTYFGTSALSHPLGEPCYIVQPVAPGAEPSPNGLPVFRLYYENDDDPKRRWGKDSQLLFTAAQDGEYLVRLRDVTGRGGPAFNYRLSARPRREDFAITVAGMNPVVSPGSGKEFGFKVERIDDYEGEVRVDVSGLPAGFSATTPVVIEKGQFDAFGVIYAEPDARPPTAEAMKAVKLTATARIRGEEVRHELGGLGNIKLGKPAKVRVEVLADGDSGSPKQEAGKPLELTIHPGETIRAVVRATREGGFKGEVPFGKEDAGRNLPFGVFVDNIGLSGLLILAVDTERQFFITAGPEWLPETTRLFHLRTTADGGQTTRPVLLHVRKPDRVAGR